MNQYCPQCGDDRYNSKTFCIVCNFPHMMTRDEKRAIRRQFINYYLQYCEKYNLSKSDVKKWTRHSELLGYKKSLKVY